MTVAVCSRLFPYGRMATVARAALRECVDAFTPRPLAAAFQIVDHATPGRIAAHQGVDLIQKRSPIRRSQPQGSEWRSGQTSSGDPLDSDIA
jgi:hypothetical protein